MLQVLATTDVNQIWAHISPKTCPNCNSYNNFFGEGGYNLDFTVLEEYFHVVEQWTTGERNAEMNSIKEWEYLNKPRYEQR